MMRLNFNGKTAIVTGGAVGIGRAVALMLAKNGANVSIIDVNTEKLELVKSEADGSAGNVITVKCDVSNESEVCDAVNITEKTFGKTDILVNNAALWRSNFKFTEIPADIWKRYFDVNVMGTVYFTQAVLPGMTEKNYGRIINVASVAGVYGNAGMSHYSATKGAVIALTRALAKEVAADGVTVNAVSPGTVSPAENPDMDYFQETAMSYAGRTGTDNENASLICYLASNEAGYISGQNIQIDGCRKKL